MDHVPDTGILSQTEWELRSSMTHLEPDHCMHV